MTKNSIKKIVRYDNFAREIPIKEKNFIRDEEKRENRLYYIKIISIVCCGLLLSFIFAKSIKKIPYDSSLMTQGV